MKTRIFPKAVKRGVRKVFGPTEQRSPKNLLHHPNPFCTGTSPVCTSTRGFLLPQPKRPLAPSTGHSWEFPIFDPSPRRFGLQTWIVPHKVGFFMVEETDGLAASKGLTAGVQHHRCAALHRSSVVALSCQKQSSFQRMKTLKSRVLTPQWRETP